MSLLLAVVMVLSIVAAPMSVLAAKDSPPIPEINSTKKEDSYIQTTKDIEGATEKYYTMQTPSGKSEATKVDYKSVIRGNIFLEFSGNQDLTAQNITLESKEFGFTLNGKTVKPGKPTEFILDLTKRNIITLNIPTNQDEYGNYDSNEEHTYVIQGAKAGEMIEVEAKIDVSNPAAWLDGSYKIPDGYNIDPAEVHSDYDKVQSAVTGLEQVVTTRFSVPKGTTAMGVLGMLGEKNKMNITGMEKNYVSFMGKKGYEQLGEFDINSYSGWMYTLNESNKGQYMPNVGAGSKTLTEDTEMVWHFTMAYGADIPNAPWGEPDGEPGMPGTRSKRSITEYFEAPKTLGELVPQWADSARADEIITVGQ